ncbi:MAG: glycosyltransferase family 4 protein [bacterium]|nr:glycosyltransferase family 4 protein [bacterium]
MKRSRKVFMIGWEYPPRITGGLAIACRGIARSLSALGHRVEFLIPRLPENSLDDQGVRVFAPEPEFFTETELTLYAEQWRRFQSGITPSPYESDLVGPASHRAGDATHPVASSGTRLHGLERSVTKLAAPLLEGGYGDHIYREIHAFAQLATLLAAKGDYDIIHAHDWMTFPAALSAAHATGLPVVCHIHATEFDRSGERVNQYIYDLERHALLACHHIITVSNYTRKILIDRYGAPPEKITAVHNAVEFELPERPQSEGEKISRAPRGLKVEAGKAIEAKDPPEKANDPRDRIVLFLGRITFQKGPDYFVRAARKVVEQLNGSRVRFVMVGAGDMYARMIELAADLGIGKYFHYTGFLNREQVQRIYAMSDLYVMPSVSEPFGISPLEAMVHGVPVIVSKQSGVSEVISNCIKVDFWNVDAIADAIVRVLEDGQDRARLQENGRAEVSQITWSAAADRITDVYESLLDEDAKGPARSIARVGRIKK